MYLSRLSLFSFFTSERFTIDLHYLVWLIKSCLCLTNPDPQGTNTYGLVETNHEIKDDVVQIEIIDFLLKPSQCQIQTTRFYWFIACLISAHRSTLLLWQREGVHLLAEILGKSSLPFTIRWINSIIAISLLLPL